MTRLNVDAVFGVEKLVPLVVDVFVVSFQRGRRWVKSDVKSGAVPLLCARQPVVLLSPATPMTHGGPAVSSFGANAALLSAAPTGTLPFCHMSFVLTCV